MQSELEIELATAEHEHWLALRDLKVVIAEEQCASDYLDRVRSKVKVARAEAAGGLTIDDILKPN